MRLSLPEEMDDPPEEDSADGMRESVSVMGDEMEPLAAIELLGEMLERPEAFGLVPASRLTDLNEQLAEVQAENGRLREEMEEREEWLEEAFRALSSADSLSRFRLEDPGESEP
jgi:hypothetical protein